MSLPRHETTQSNMGFRLGPKEFIGYFQYALPSDATQHRALVSPWPFECLGQSLRVGVQYGVIDTSWAQISILHISPWFLINFCNADWKQSVLMHSKINLKIDTCFLMTTQYPACSLAYNIWARMRATLGHCKCLHHFMNYNKVIIAVESSGSSSNLYVTSQCMGMHVLSRTLSHPSRPRWFAFNSSTNAFFSA
jgi:hypothetical protein